MCVWIELKKNFLWSRSEEIKIESFFSKWLNLHFRARFYSKEFIKSKVDNNSLIIYHNVFEAYKI